MDSELYRRLRDMAYQNAMAHQLLQLWEMGGLSYQEWSSKAILALIEQNDIYFRAAVDAEGRAYPKPMMVPQS
jgi:hypothetical protein